jgi:hypothetical protein
MEVETFLQAPAPRPQAGGAAEGYGSVAVRAEAPVGPTEKGCDRRTEHYNDGKETVTTVTTSPFACCCRDGVGWLWTPGLNIGFSNWPRDGHVHAEVQGLSGW